MKRTVLAITAIILASTAYAGEDKKGKGVNKEEFVAQQKAKSEEKGWKFELDKVEATFDAMDSNDNGLVTGKERKAYYASKNKKD